MGTKVKAGKSLTELKQKMSSAGLDKVQVGVFSDFLLEKAMKPSDNDLEVFAVHHLNTVAAKRKKIVAFYKAYQGQEIDRPDPVKASALTIMRMSCDSKGKLPQTVIQDGQRKQWVGIGWVTEGPASEEDYKAYPEVLDE